MIDEVITVIVLYKYIFMYIFIITSMHILYFHLFVYNEIFIDFAYILMYIHVATCTFFKFRDFVLISLNYMDMLTNISRLSVCVCVCVCECIRIHFMYLKAMIDKWNNIILLTIETHPYIFLKNLLTKEIFTLMNLFAPNILGRLYILLVM